MLRIFRRTYFGELLLTRSSLQHRHDLSTAQIKGRWLPQVHQVVDAERILRRMLGEAASWDELAFTARQLQVGIANIRSEKPAWSGRFSSTLPEFVSTMEGFAALLDEVHQSLKNGDFELMRHLLRCRPQSVNPVIRTLPSRLPPHTSCAVWTQQMHWQISVMDYVCSTRLKSIWRQASWSCCRCRRWQDATVGSIDCTHRGSTCWHLAVRSRVALWENSR